MVDRGNRSGLQLKTGTLVRARVLYLRQSLHVSTHQCLSLEKVPRVRWSIDLRLERVRLSKAVCRSPSFCRERSTLLEKTKQGLAALLVFSSIYEASNLIPGPMLVVMVADLMKIPFEEAGLFLLMTSSTAVRFSLIFSGPKLTLPISR